MANAYSSDSPDNELYFNFITTGDEEPFRILFDRYRSPLILFIDDMVHNSDDAEDLMMDCFARVISLQARYTGRNGASFKTWLFTIARNRTYSFLRRNGKDIQQSEPDMYVEADSTGNTNPDSKILKNERDIKLKAALDTLPADYRTALYLTYYENMRSVEIAQIMNKSIKQIYNLIARGKDRLRESLKEDGYTWDI